MCPDPRVPALPLPSALAASTGIALALACGCQMAESPSAPLSALPSLPTLQQVLRTEPAGRPRETRRDGCRTDMARVDDFCVDRFEAHIVLLRNGVERVHAFNQPLCDAHGGMACSDLLTQIQARSAPDVLPQAYVNQVQAEAACRHAGKRLCTRREWRRACMGSRRTVYPYGNMARASYCNTQRGHALAVLHGHDPRNWTYAQFNDPRLNELPNTLVPTGASLDCASDFGVYDAVGNVQEWVSDTVQTGPHRGNGIFMGAFYGNRGDEAGIGCSYEIAAHEPAYHDYSVGFRCCGAAE